MKTITFITRLSRSNIDIQAIYNSIKSNFDSYYWLVYIEKGTIAIPDLLQNIKNNDDSVIINTDFIRDGNQDIHFSKAIDEGFNSVYAKNSEWIYVVDDDNIVHNNLSSVINKAINVDLIINKVEDKRGVHYLDNPQNLSVNHCVCHVDWANGVFSSEFFSKNIKHIITKTRTSDGITVKLFLEHSARVFYSNEIAGYYNFLR